VATFEVGEKEALRHQQLRASRRPEAAHESKDRCSVRKNAVSGWVGLRAKLDDPLWQREHSEDANNRK